MFLVLSILVAAAAAIACLAICRRKERCTAEDQEAQVKDAGEVQPTIAVEGQLTTPQEEVSITGETQPIVEKAQTRASQETELIVSQEPRPTAPPETEVTKQEATGLQEAEQIAGEKRQPQTAVEETQPITPEKTEPTVAEEIQERLAGESRPGGPQKGKRREPIRIGGRPRGVTQGLEEATIQTTAQRRPKLEIVCWKRERQWFVGVEVLDELAETSGSLEIYQNGQLVSPDDYEETRWLLHSISGEIVVRLRDEDSSQDFELTVGQESYLLFKLSGRDWRQGRLVRQATFGSYLVVAKDTWEREEAKAGPPPVAPEPVALEGYVAHFFDLEKGIDVSIAFVTPQGELISIASASTRFELVGEILEDTSEGIGPLFNTPSQIRASDQQAWREIKTIVVGEEGRGRGKWRSQFSPNPERIEQDLPDEVLMRKGGWYFLRLYDKNDELVESMDFRFLTGLHQIEMPQLPPLPPNDGYRPVRIQLLHEPGIIMHLEEDLSNISIEQENGKTILTIPPEPRCDVTHWKVGYENGPWVGMTVLVERVWWGIGDEENGLLEWKDVPLILERDDFTATSKKGIWLRFPKNRWMDTIFVGFKRAKRRSYSVRVRERMLSVPLREFADAEEVADRVREHQLRVWIERNGQSEAVVAVLPRRWRVYNHNSNGLGKEDTRRP